MFCTVQNSIRILLACDTINHVNVFIIQIENELNSICGDVLEVLDKHLIPAAQAGESKVFYYKM